MPRPPVRRRRQNSFSPKKQIITTESTQARQVLERKLSDKPVGKRPQDSDDSDALVTTRTPSRNRKRQEIYASGAVAKGDKPGGYPTRAQRNRTMRENTTEILSQRSRSASRATSVVSATPPAALVVDKEKSAQETRSRTTPELSSKKEKRIQEKPITVASNPTPRAEVSVLGKIKPRKRQASILQLIENDANNESSIINSDDEAQFLPDEVSTPTAQNRRSLTSSTSKESTSLKRKRGTEEPETATNKRPFSSPRSADSNQIPPPSRSQNRKLSNAVVQLRQEDDIMAPPESSDEDEGPDKEAGSTRPPHRSDKQKPVALSTQQLQNLMPSKKHQQPPRRKQPPRAEFDIPADSTDNTDDEVDEEDHSSFMPASARKKTKRPQRGTKKAITKGLANQSKPRPKDKKAKSTIAQTPSPDTTMRVKASNTPLATANSAKGVKKRYGGSRRQAAGKENQPISLSEEPSDIDGVQKSNPIGSEVRAWNRKWADIDDFDLAFEDVSMSTRSSSPLRR
ncbi:hypothetical protein LTR05_008070 [Lithohypha guttulata]|uniref:Uncharacterized protein n=1 Tax=Lithohypha guttulata TaxID=1690604 RepID=A0AAN7YD20_9EURO|nr:hypothetical protein LTR05_008070 [Lithohypha guttulata]